MFKDLKLS